MGMKKELPQRKYPRLGSFDYNSGGAYFVTVCTHQRRRILSKIERKQYKAYVQEAGPGPECVGGDVLVAPQTELTRYGMIVDRYINQLNDFYDNISVEKYVIMPNHIHILMMVYDDGATGTSPPTKQHAAVPRFVSTLKRFCSREIGASIFQRSFYDHIIRNHQDFEEIYRYIEENPAKWELDELYTNE